MIKTIKNLKEKYGEINNEFNINDLLYKEKFSEDILRYFKESLNWEDVLNSQYDLSENFIIEMEEYIDFDILQNDTELLNEFSLDFINRYKDRIDCNKLIVDKNYDKDLLVLLKDDIEWDFSPVEKIKDYDDIIFLEKVKDYIDWWDLSSEGQLQEETLSYFEDYIEWDVILNFCDYEEDFIREHFFYFEDKNVIIENMEVSESFLEEFECYLDWNAIVIYQSLSEEFMRKHLDKLSNDWGNVSRFQYLSEDFIREFYDKVDWTSISEMQEISKELARDFQDKIDFEILNSRNNSGKFNDILKEFYY